MLYGNMVKEIQLENRHIEIYQDEYGVDPREWDNLGTMAFYHRRYNLGDKHEFARNVEFTEYYDDTPEELVRFLQSEKVIYLPVYIYDHSGIALSTTNRRYPFNCQWDSGQLGYIYVTYEKVKSEWNWKYLTKKRINKILDILQAEVDTYNYFVQSRVYGYAVVCDFCGDNVDSCWGFYGEDWKENGLLDYAEDVRCNCENRVLFRQKLMAEGVGL